MSWMNPWTLGTPKAMNSAANGSVQAKRTYSRIGAPKKKPSVSSVGVSGETR